MFDFLTNRFSSLFSTLTGKSHLTEKNIAEAIEKVRDSLIEADVPHSVVDTFIEEIKKDVIGKKVLQALKPSEQFIKVTHERLKAFLGGENKEDFTFKTPTTVMVMGLQGSGKTTTIAKMARYAKNQAKHINILLASVDFYRPAAIDQLEILARQINAHFYRSPHTDPVQAAIDIQATAKKQSVDLLFLDTAGRLHVDTGMLDELRVIDQQLTPAYKILVLDAMTGQESLNVAKAFDQAVGFGHAVLTKIDSDTRGGAAFSFRYVLKKPIVFVGSGEKVADLALFHPDRMASQILGMGDVLTLIEKAEQSVKQSEQDRIIKAMMSGRMTLKDFADQLGMMTSIGSLASISKFMPSMGGMKLSAAQIEQGEKELKKFKAIINSMTPKERIQHKLLDGSRKKRIAQGAGVTPADVNQLLTKFEETQQYAKLFSKFFRI